MKVIGAEGCWEEELYNYWEMWHERCKISHALHEEERPMINAGDRVQENGIKYQEEAMYLLLPTEIGHILVFMAYLTEHFGINLCGMHLIDYFGIP